MRTAIELAEHRRDAFVLHQQGKSTKEIAETLGCSKESARTAVNRAKQILRIRPGVGDDRATWNYEQFMDPETLVEREKKYAR